MRAPGLHIALDSLAGCHPILKVHLCGGVWDSGLDLQRYIVSTNPAMCQGHTDRGSSKEEADVLKVRLSSSLQPQQAQHHRFGCMLRVVCVATHMANA
jgi:hypothetical protein